MRTLIIPVIAGLLGLAVGLMPAADDKKDIDPYDQSGVPLEKQPTDAKLTKIVLVAGRQSHGPGDHEFFAGCAILMKMLKQTPGVFPVMARDGWPKNPKTFENAKAVVFYMDGGGGHPILHKGHKEVVDGLIDKKVGFVNLHYAVEYPKSQSDHVYKWLGGYYETGFSTNPHWDAEFKTLPEHAITRGVKPFKIRDEWYFNIRFKPEAKNLTPILKSTPPDGVRRTEAAKQNKGRSEVVAWAFERADGGRSFGFTGGHTHRNWANEDFRRLVVNAILWSAGVDIPKGGAVVKLNADEINRNLDPKFTQVPIENRTKKTIAFQVGVSKYELKAGEKKNFTYRPGSGKFQLTATLPGAEKKAEINLARNTRYAFIEKKDGIVFEKVK